MGQAWSSLQNKLEGTKRSQVRKITYKVIDRLIDDSKKHEEEAHLTFEDVYVAVLCVYNDINKYLPWRNYHPPSPETLKEFMNEFDVGLDSLLDREEFAEFIEKLTS